MRQYFWFFVLMVLSLPACSVNGVEKVPTPTTSVEAMPEATATLSQLAAATELPTPISTATAPPVPTSLPTAAPSATATQSLTPTQTPTPNAIELPGPDILHQGIRFSLDDSLAAGMYLAPADEPLVVAEFRLQPEGFCREVGCVKVYLAAAFETNIPGGAEIMAALQTAVSNPASHYIPTWGAAILLQAQTQHLLFQNGSGLRALVMRGQDSFFANNEALVYDFHGLTDDGLYYINVQIPIDAPILLSTFDPAKNTNTNALPVPDPLPSDYLELGDVIQEYNAEAAQELNLLAADAFTPDLTLLDALVISLLIVPEGNGS